MCQPSLFVYDQFLCFSLVFQNTNVEKRCEDSTYERSYEIEPDIGIVATDNGWTECSRGIERCPRQGTPHQDAKHEC